MSETKPAYLKVLARTLRSYAGSACLSLDLSHALDEAAEELDRRASPATHTGDVEAMMCEGACDPNPWWFMHDAPQDGRCPQCGIPLTHYRLAALAARSGKGGGE